MATFLVNGETAVSLPLTDRGLHYGDGLFETIAVRSERLLHWDAHMQRLLAGCQRLGLMPPDTTLLEAEALRIVEQQGTAVLKIILTRGSGGRGYATPDEAEPTRILGLYPAPQIPASHYTDGVRVHRCTTPLAHQPLLAGIKHLNRLEQVLARNEWNSPEIAEGLMYDIDGRLVEGVSSNVFIVREQCLHTPALERCGVAGTTRARILALARQWGLDTEVHAFEPDEEAQAEEMFLCNSLIGIWPIRAYGAWSAPLGPITDRLMAAMPAPFALENRP